MTATTTTPSATTAGAGRRAPRPGAAPGALALLPLSELAAAAVSLATVVSLRRVFVGTEWLAPLVLQVVLAHAVAAGLRRRGVRLLPSVLVMGGLAALVISWIYAGQLTTMGVPTTSAFDALLTSVGDAVAAFGDVKAPTEALDGFLVATSVAVWSGAALADWAAFRVDAPIEATLPSATLFVLAAVLGADVDRVLLTGLWVATVLAFVLLRRADRLGRTATWVGERRSRGPRSLVVLGAALTMAAVVIAAVVGPRLPGADSEAIVSLTDLGDGGPGTRVTVSPLVDIRSRLVDQADVEVFTVRSDVRSYWRLTSLERFDGRIWSSNGSYGEASGDLDDGVPVASPRIDFRQTYEISALAQIWLPAAYEPEAVQAPIDVRYDEVSGTLIVDTEIPTSDGAAYQVTSALPQHEANALASASSAVPAEIAEQYLTLPADFSPRVRDLARQIVAGSASAYEASVRLQDHFRDYTYDLDVGSGHSENAIERFVFDLRRGYCEQFAGSFAAMARSVGIPARVAVGFTPGNTDPSDPTLYRVRGEHAHAWPEVFLGEYGWVSFEPTPGRGAPFAEQYTGVPEQQVQSGGDATTATTTVTPPSTVAPTPTTAPPVPTSVPGDVDTSTGEVGDDSTSPWFRRIAATAAVLVLLAGLYLLTVLAVTAVRQQRRRRAAVDPAAQVALAWDESLSAVRRVGVPVRAADTQSEAARRIGRRLPSVQEPMETLAITVEHTAYAPIGPDAETGTGALALADEITRGAQSTLSTSDRFKDRFHPRRLLDR